MAKKKSVLKLSEDAIRIILIILGSVFATLILTFAVLAIIKLGDNDLKGASIHLLLVFVVLAFSRLVTFLQARNKPALMRFLFLFIVDIALGILIYFGKENPYLYCLCGGFYCITIIISRIFKLIDNHSIRSIVFNAIIITLAALLAVGLFVPYNDNLYYSPVIVVCFVVAISALIEVLSGTATRLNVKTLFKIIFRTFALEIILGLLTMMVASALILYHFEASIPTFADGLWFAFETVTTIGYGEYSVTTGIGRVISVFLGIYGIVVVAVITSIIVNFYNETAGKHDSGEIKEIKDEQENKTKKKK